MNSDLLNICWILVCACLVFLMQAGFLCVEAGLTRTKNSINCAFKNVSDFAVAVFIYWAFGYALMYGETQGGWIGFSAQNLLYSPLGEEAGKDAAYFMFQMMYASTGATIISGATAERLRYLAYMLVTVIFTGLIYPFVGHWVWSTDVLGLPSGWLNKMGFIDFGGSTVVHSAAGWTSLALLIIIGPRKGKYDEKGKPRDIPPSNMPMAMLGVILLCFGWVGMTGGSVTVFDATVPPIVLNTMVGASAGLLFATTFLYWAGRFRWIRETARVPNIGLMLNALLAGLVSSNATCHLITAPSAFLVGGIGGLLCVGTHYLLDRYRIDDAVGALSVHLTPGIWGTLAVGIFATPELLGREVNHAAMIQAQLIGIVACGLWAFGVSFLIFKTVNRFSNLRVTPEDENIGLNVAEHGAKTEMVVLLDAMVKHEKTGDLSQPVPVEPFSEIGQIARQYNRVLESLDNAVGRIKAVFRDLSDGIVTFADNGLITSLNPAAERLLGLPAASANGMPMWDLVMGAHRKNTEAHQLEDAEPLDLFVPGKTQEIHYFTGGRAVQAVELTVSKGKLHTQTVYTGLLRDVTKRLESETSRQQLMKKLLKAQNLQLMGMLSNSCLPEVGTLQAIILGSAELARQKSPSVHSEMEDIHQSATKSREILKFLETMGQTDLRDTPRQDANAAVRNLLSSARARQWLGEDVLGQVQVKFDGDGFQIQAQERQFADAILPFVHNAIKASPPDHRVDLTLAPVSLDLDRAETEVIPKGDYLRISITDRGSGIPLSVQSRLFEPYASAYVSDTFRRGEGLGMAMAHGLIKYLRGFVEVKTSAETGTSVRVYLPLHRERSQEQATPATSGLSGSGSILILEDHPAIAAAAAQILGSAGYRTTVTSTVAAAAAALKDNRFDLALLDLVVSDGLDSLNGFASLRARLPANLPVLATAGEDVAWNVASDALEKGAHQVLRKPFAFATLASAVKKAKG